MRGNTVTQQLSPQQLTLLYGYNHGTHGKPLADDTLEDWKSHVRIRKVWQKYSLHYTIHHAEAAAVSVKPEDMLTVNYLLGSRTHSDHFPVTCEFGGEVVAFPIRLRKDFHRVNWVVFQRTIDSLLEENPALTDTNDINNCPEMFQQALEGADRAYIRKVPVKVNVISIDRDTKYHIRLRNIFRRQFQRTGDLVKRQLVSHLNEVIKCRMERLKNESFGKVVQGLKDHSKPFRNVAKVLNSTTEISDHFARSHNLGNSMQSPFETAVEDKMRSLDETTCVVPQDQLVTVDVVRIAIRNTKNMKTLGFDKVFNLVLKNLSRRALTLLANIFNKFWLQERPANEGDKHQKAEQSCLQVDCNGSTYVEKAFDNVWHDELIYKLCVFKVPIYLTQIVRSYLHDRTFKVVLQGAVSKVYSIPAGVPQGSLLGPMLYNLFTSDIPRMPDGSCLSLFADDTALLVKGKKVTELRSKLQRCFDIFIEYTDKWKLN
ncbi:uncharacterized protein LOC131693411 [Topomyia yanbarensis]|uniref:uncharacterized protein LOC131693411 n=1 Tax=Topomyia yanbarensis TaxID=2498891 RepID=UPI00273C5F52|nr:uncharacterized protein LOC131693411 [Topomyia yanbarensis]